MIIRINGKTENIEKCPNIASLVSDRGLIPERLVVEHNLKVIPMEDWQRISLKENDVIEIISFVGGG